MRPLYVQPRFYFFKHLTDSKLISQDSSLAKLLNDESFIRWLKGTASRKEKKRWDQWLSKDSQNKRTVEKARKILTIPFKTKDAPDVFEELEKLREQLKKQDRLKGSIKKDEN